MGCLSTDLLRDAAHAERAAELAAAAQYAFHLKVQAFEWATIEEARRTALDALDGYLDTLLAIHQRLELAGAKPQPVRRA